MKYSMQESVLLHGCTDKKAVITHKSFWPAYVAYAIITGVNSFIMSVPKIIYIPVIGVCAICFILQMIDVLKELMKSK